MLKGLLEERRGQPGFEGLLEVFYLILGMSSTDEQQLQSPQVTHPLTWTSDGGL